MADDHAHGIVKNVQIDLRELLKPEFRAFYDAKAKHLDDLRIEIDYERATGTARVTTNENGDFVFWVPRSGIIFNLDVLLQLSDAQVASFAKADPQLQAASDAVAAKMGITTKIKAVIAWDNEASGVFMSKDGTAYMRIQPHQLKSPYLKGIIAHEQAHIAMDHHHADEWAELFHKGGREAVQQLGETATLQQKSEAYSKGSLAALRQAEDRADTLAIKHGFGPKIIAAKISQYADKKYELRQAGKSLEDYSDKDQHTPFAYRIGNMVNQTIAVTKEATMNDVAVPPLPKSGGPRTR